MCGKFTNELIENRVCNQTFGENFGNLLKSVSAACVGNKFSYVYSCLKCSQQNPYETCYFIVNNRWPTSNDISCTTVKSDEMNMLSYPFEGPWRNTQTHKQNNSKSQKNLSALQSLFVRKEKQNGIYVDQQNLNQTT